LASYPVAYTDVPLPACAAFPNGRTAIRPALIVTLVNQGKQISCYGIVDSGADHCVFPRSFMQPLGLDPLTAPTEMSSGLGTTNMPTHFCNITIDLGVIKIPVYAGFTVGMDQLGFGLLGQAGFFEAFKITFDYRNKLFHVEIP
jgi:hypothetical protein